MNVFIEWINTLDSSTVLLVSSLFILVVNLLLLRRNRKQQVNTEVVHALQRDLRALTSASVGMGERVMDMERRQRHMTKRVEPQPVQKVEPANPTITLNQPYENAIRLAQQGVKAEELVKTCGLSTSEAELIATMHRLEKAS